MNYDSLEMLVIGVLNVSQLSHSDDEIRLPSELQLPGLKEIVVVCPAGVDKKYFINRWDVHSLRLDYTVKLPNLEH